MAEERFGYHETVENVNNGDDFQLVMAKFILHRLIKLNFKNFKLTREKKNCGKFDDLVFVYEDNDGRLKYHLLQLKCLANEEYKISFDDLTANPNSYFLLPYYYDHYIESRKYLSIDSDFVDADLVELIICTNAGIEDSFKWISIEDLPNTGVFQNSGNLCKLSINERDKRKEIFYDQFLSERKRLSKELVLTVMLSKPINIQSMIRDRTTSLIKKYYQMLLTHVIDLKSKKFKTSFLDNNFEESIEKLRSFRKDFLDSLIEFCEEFKDKQYEDLKKLIYFGRFKNVTSQKSKINTFKKLVNKFSCEETVQFLANRNIEIGGIPDEDTEICFPSGDINDEVVDENIMKFMRLLTLALNQTENEKLISAEVKNQSLHKGFNNYMKNWYCKGVSHHSDTPKGKKYYRKWITEENLLGELEKFHINFNGKELAFLEICPPSEVNTPETLMCAFSEQKALTFGKPVENMITQAYIVRTLTQISKLKPNVFEANANCFIIVALKSISDKANLQQRFQSDIKIEDLAYFEERHPFYYTCQKFDLQEFRDFYLKYQNGIKNKHIHLLVFLGTDLKYKSSYPPSDFLELYGRCDMRLTEFELAKKEKFIIITGDPGAGKSVLLKHVLQSISHSMKFQNCWVIRISLIECGNIFTEFSNFNRVDSVIDFLARCESCNNELFKSILQLFLEKESRLVILFDGYDELRYEQNQEKFIDLVRFLKNETSVKQIWISSRSYFVDELEKELGVVSYEIEDISENDQVNLLMDCWKEVSKTLDSSYESKLDKEEIFRRWRMNSINLIRNFNRSITHKERNFLGIPLHTYILAFAFEEVALNEVPLNLEPISLTRLYEQYFKKKFDIYFKKIKQNTLIEELSEYFEDQYQNFALEYSGLISYKNAMVLKNKVSDYKIKTLLDIGLLYENGNSYHFLHRTFAEYLIANLLASHSEADCSKNSVGNVIEEILLDKRNSFISHVFDAKLVEKHEDFKIFKYIMHGNEDWVAVSGKNTLSKLDSIGRSAFYYAIKYRQLPITSHLMEKDIELNIEIFLFNCLLDFRYSFRDGNESNENYIKLFEYILEKESVGGIFAEIYLDKLLDVDMEIRLKHWNIARQLIYKFNKRLCCPVLDFINLKEAPLDFIDIYIKTFDIDDYFLQFSMMTRGLLNLQTHILKHIIDNHKDFITKIPRDFDLVDHFYIQNNNYFSVLESMNFSEYINSIENDLRNFIILFGFLFKFWGISFEEFNKEYMEFFGEMQNALGLKVTDNICYKLIPENVQPFKDRSIESLKSSAITGKENERVKDLLKTLTEYRDICNYNEETTVEEATRLIIHHILMKYDRGKLAHVRQSVFLHFHEHVNEDRNKWLKYARKKFSKYFHFERKPIPAGIVVLFIYIIIIISIIVHFCC